MTEHNRSLRDFWSDFHSEAFRQELRTSWSTALLYRWVGIALAYVAHRLNIRPIWITLAALVVALALPMAAAFGGSFAAVFVLTLALLFQVLDCADGTLARTTAQVSKQGGDLDFLVDMLQWGMLYLAIGMLADAQFDTGWYYAAIATLAAWARLLARVTRDRLAHVESSPREQKGEGFPGLIARFLGGISGLIPFLALSGDWLYVAVWALLVYGSLDILEGGLPLLRRP